MMTMLPSGLDSTVADDEELARFLTSSSLFNAVMPKPAAFLPNCKDGTTSVFRHGADPPESLWQIARKYAIGDRKLYGAAVCKAAHVRAALLEIEAVEPPPRHANITGWPWLVSDRELEKAQLKERAALIAKHAALILL